MGKRVPEVDENMLRQAEELAGYGLSLPQIAAVLGFSERTLHNRKNDNDALDAALRRGRAKAAALVGQALFHRAREGDVPAIRWWEMTREGRSEKVQAENKVEVVNETESDARLARLLGSAWTDTAGQEAQEDEPG